MAAAIKMVWATTALLSKATNIAETSLTVDGIKYVIDTGAGVSCFDAHAGGGSTSCFRSPA